MTDNFDLSRFLSAQESVFETALSELRRGSKQTHWMWFIFPQLRGLGRSRMADYYGIASRAEAAAYLAHPVLGDRLVRCTQTVLDVEGRSVHQIFGSPDDLKFQSSMTLFREVSDAATNPFQSALDKYFDGTADDSSLRLLGR